MRLLTEKFPEILISVDTFRSNIAASCIASGATIINDISAGNLDPMMIPTLGKLKVPYIMMHMKGTPQNMKSLTQYEEIITEINTYFSEKITQARQQGIHDIIIDPGFGFAKDIAQNFKVLKNLEILRFHNLPILAGVSRKSMIYKTINKSPKEALNGTTVLNTIALMNRAAILRVHDVNEAIECIRLVDAYHKADH